MHVYLHGDSLGKGTHMTIDNLLPWAIGPSSMRLAKNLHFQWLGRREGDEHSLWLSHICQSTRCWPPTSSLLKDVFSGSTGVQVFSPTGCDFVAVNDVWDVPHYMPSYNHLQPQCRPPCLLPYFRGWRPSLAWMCAGQVDFWDWAFRHNLCSDPCSLLGYCRL